MPNGATGAKKFGGTLHMLVSFDIVANFGVVIQLGVGRFVGIDCALMPTQEAKNFHLPLIKAYT